MRGCGVHTVEAYPWMSNAARRAGGTRLVCCVETCRFEVSAMTLDGSVSCSTGIIAGRSQLWVVIRESLALSHPHHGHN